MTFEAWLIANGYDAAALNDKQRKHLEAAWKADTVPPEPPKTPEAKPPAKDGGTESSFDQRMAAIEDESRRVEYIQEATARAAERYVGMPDRLRQLRELCASAIADKKTDPRGFDLALLRFDRLIGPMVFAPKGQESMTEDVLEAAVCMTAKLPGVEKKFGDQVLQAAHSRFRRGIGLQELLMIAAERNAGYRGSARDVAALCRAAFRPSGADFGHHPYPSAGPSTIAVPGILSNIANKFLEAGFLYTEQAWRQIARIKPANDFKTMTRYRLTGNNKFEKVAPGGEIKQGSLSELTYTNKVDTYGKMLGIDRRDIRNDDLGAFTGAGDELGRGAGDSLNEIFWGVWLDDSSFFNTDKSKNNYDDGTDTVLGLAGLDNIESIFRAQTKPDGTPLGAMPAILLVPAVLTNTALTLMGAQGLVVGTTPASGPNLNVFYGRYRVVSSVYPQSSAISGYSTTAWWLLADPNNIPCIEAAFLDGVETPIVETSEFDFDMLGIAMRAYMDWGCNKQEYRGGVKAKGTT